MATIRWRFQSNKQTERVALLGIIRPGMTEGQVREHIDELAFLVRTAGGDPVFQALQRRPYPHPRTFLGQGKIYEVKQTIKQLGIETVVCDNELSPSQIRNLEQLLGCKILDRTLVILDIFARHARTSESKTQVELAQLQYMLPRLTRLWTHLSRQKGGIGMRGPGEKEIETDRRIIRNQIALLKKRLERIHRQRAVRRSNRVAKVRVALVGYTNVGKTTILNALTGERKLSADKLFATLDTTVKQVVVDGVPFLLSDTVGFIRKLPTHLIESFKSTLAEAKEADILMHVVDISHPAYLEQIRSVHQTLHSLGMDKKVIWIVGNKIDRAPNPPSPVELQRFTLNAPQPPLLLSALDKMDIQRLKTSLKAMVMDVYEQRYPYVVKSIFDVSH